MKIVWVNFSQKIICLDLDILFLVSSPFVISVETVDWMLDTAIVAVAN